MLESSEITQSSVPTIWSQFKIREVFNLSNKEYRGTQIFSVLLIIGVFLGLNKFTRESLSSDVSSVLIEAKILKLISSIFVSTEVLWSIFHVIIMIIFGSFIENIRGTYTLLIYIIQICLISELLTLIIFLSLYYFTFETFYLERRVCGFDAMIGAFIMCITEISPDYVVISNINILTFQYLPFTFVIFISILHLIGLLGITQMCLIIIGTWIGWVILRYFAPNIQNKYEKGNNSEEFELQYLFPPILRFPVRQISNITYAIFKNVGCCEPPMKRQQQSTSSNDNKMLSDNLNELVLGLNQQQSDIQSDNDSIDNIDNFTKPKNDIEAQRRQQAKALIEQRLQKIQKEYNQRVIKGANQNKDTNI
eukprot:110633_1